MTSGSAGKSNEIRSHLDHPVVDADGHWIELFPVFFDYIDEVAGSNAVDIFRQRYGHRFHSWYESSEEERRRRRSRRPSYWGVPTKAADRAASTIPALFYERLDEWGIDLALVFPSIGLTLGRDLADPELSNAIIRSYNTMAADMFSNFADRMIPAGVLSLADPADAVDQMVHAHGLGLKMLVTGGTVPRTIEVDADWQPEESKRRSYIDTLALDSPYDYDPVWRKFVELGIPVTSHSGSMGWPDRNLPSNFVANHLGHFAQSHHAFARSLFLGGVTQRFPELTFAFLEGGVGWACNLYADLQGHWEKRNRRYMDDNLRPTNLDQAEFRRLYEAYGSAHPKMEGKLTEILASNLDALESDISQEELTARDLASNDFAHVDIQSKDDVRRLFAENFYFGCEADDPMTAIAFDDRMNLRLKPLFGSDISHFDVVDPAEVLEEAWELVDDRLISEENFRQFTFDNVVELYGRMNSDFFSGTVVENQAKEHLANLAKGNLAKGNGAKAELAQSPLS